MQARTFDPLQQRSIPTRVHRRAGIGRGVVNRLAIGMGWLAAGFLWCAGAQATATAAASTLHPPQPEPSLLSRPLSQTLWGQTGRDRGIDPVLLYSVALVESARHVDQAVAPWPWAMNRNGETTYPLGREAAEVELRAALAGGRQSIDIGLMQVNLRWHGHRVHRAEDLLDPATNLQVGADILAEAIASAPGNLVLGVGRYHSWHDREAAYRYGRRVLALAERLRSLPI